MLEQALTSPVTSTDSLDMKILLATLTAYRNGDFSARMPGDWTGLPGKIADKLNEIIDMSSDTITEFERVARLVGKQGKVGERIELPMMRGSWEKLVDSSNALANDLVSPMNEMIHVIGSVAEGDLGQQVPMEIDGLKLKGQFLKSAEIVNTMVARLGSFASEVTRVAREVGTEGKLGGQANVPGAAGTWRDLTDNVNGLAANLTNQVRAIADVATAVTKGDLTRNVQVEAKGEVAELKDNVNEMIRNLRETTRQNADQDWLKTNLAKFTRLLQGQRDLAAVSKMVLSELAPLINAQHGVFYMMDGSEVDNPKLKLLSAYAYNEKVHSEWRLGEGLIGQCAYEKKRILLTDVPSHYVAITSGLGEAAPLNIIVLPIVFENQVKAVVEMASFTLYSAIHQTFLDQLAESIGIVLNTIEANMRTEELLKQSQSLAQELQSQQEELRQTNEELEDKASLLEEQKAEVERKNREVEIAKLSLEEKAEQLTLASKYKSEFLSSMSHEFRTPLNSLLILAQQLSDNVEKNLSARQVEYARTIQGSGKDLLGLINEILDLSKIESGTVSLDLTEALFTSLHDQIERTFRPVADSHNLGFTVELAASLPAITRTDQKRLLQVLKNLLSNAFKFTERGGVNISIAPVVSGWTMDHVGLNRADTVIAFAVTDTGIGVSPDKQKLIFEAFQQADTGTSRKYGGTGLGLSISRELARLLGGELRLISSELGKGSTFALFVPLRTFEVERIAPESQIPDAEPRHVNREVAVPPAIQIIDDREIISPNDHVLLMVENDVRFASILLASARKMKFSGIVAACGADAMNLVERFKPTAITLDLHLPDIDGWSILERLKRNPATRHIPVQVLSADDDRVRGLRYGVYEYLVKPVTADEIQNSLIKIVKFAQRKTRNLLVVGGHEKRCANIVDLISNDDVRITVAASGKEALTALKKKSYDCIVLDPYLPDMPAIALLEAIQANDLTSEIPIIVYGIGELPKPQQEHLRSLIGKGIIKEVQSPERLLDETALFLHRAVSELPKTQRVMLEKLYQGSNSLAGKKVLIVDDDIRNIFALASVLEHHKMIVNTAENGRTAIELLQQHADTDIVLMDIMMPEMDGFETMRQIRTLQQFESLPMIALTAKAMKGDREKCIEAGASDYVSKPVDTDQLLSLMRVWLYH